MIVILVFLSSISSLFFSSSLSFEFNGSYKISPNPCTVPIDAASSSPSSSKMVTGTCMFVWECLKSDGKHLGMCVDGFMFGSCCEINKNENNSNNGHDKDKDKDHIHPSSSSNSVITTSSTTVLHEIDSSVSDNDVDSGDSIEVPFLTKDKFTSTTRKPVVTSSTTTRTTTVPSTSTPSTTISTTSRTTTPRPSLPPHPHPTYTFINPYTTTTTTPSSSNPSSSSDNPSLVNGTSSTLPPPSVYPCGIAPLHITSNALLPQSRIVGGSEAKYAQFPWQVSVRRTSFFGFSSTHRCGGALVSEEWVATAGHCVDDLLTSQIRIRLGEYDFSSQTEPHPHKELTVVKKVVHPNYNFFTYENDLALLKLETPVRNTPNIVPICLPGNDDLLIGETGTVTGWGRLSEGGQLPNKLQHVQVPIISNEKCRDMFLKSGRMEYIPDIFLCAGYEQGGRDSCQGDSGGPLQVIGRDKRYFLAGIISWGIGCAEPNMPGVCTRISKFRDFIIGVVKGES